MTAYRKMMEQIALDEDTLREKAAQMQGMSAHGKIRQHRTGKHRLLRITAAAAAVLVFGTVTVGAVNNWDYKGIFTKYFSEKSGQTVDYDFTGMGLDLGDVIEGDGYTLFLDALLTDSRCVYLSYHYTGNFDNTFRTLDIVTATSTPHEYLRSAFCNDAECDENGVYHGLYYFRLRDPDISLADKQLTISLNGTELTYPLSDITVQKGISVPYGGTLPDDANEIKFDTVNLTPFMMEFTLITNTSYAELPNVAEIDDLPLTITAVYQNGSEKTVKHLNAKIGSTGWSSAQPDGSYVNNTEKAYYFASPVDLEGITAIRINDTEIPIQ